MSTVLEGSCGLSHVADMARDVMEWVEIEMFGRVADALTTDVGGRCQVSVRQPGCGFIAASDKIRLAVLRGQSVTCPLGHQTKLTFLR